MFQIKLWLCMKVFIDDKKYSLQKDKKYHKNIDHQYNKLIGKRNLIIVQNHDCVEKVFKLIQGVKKPHFRPVQGTLHDFR